MPPEPGAPSDWFAYARDDLRAAQVLVEAEDVNTIVATAQLQQAIEKALKGFLLARGWDLVRTHDLTFLLGKALEHDPELEQYRALCEVATEAYLEERYPGAGRSKLARDRALRLLEEGRDLIERLAPSGAGR